MSEAMTRPTQKLFGEICGIVAGLVDEDLPDHQIRGEIRRRYTIEQIDDADIEYLVDGAAGIRRAMRVYEPGDERDC